MLPGPRRALRRIGRSNDVLTFVSQYARRRISSALGPMAALEYLPPGVRTSTFRPDPAARRRMRDTYGLRGSRVLLCVSRLVARKGQDRLIRALPAVRARIPDVLLMIVGDGPHARRLRGIATQLGVDDRVVFTGGVPWSDLPALYAAGDVFAMPCRTRGCGLDVEGLGIVFLEAQASGLPVIAGRSGGAPETVLPDRTGLVVDGRDVSQIADAAAGLLADADRRRDWGAAGRAWVQSAWNWDSSAARLSELLSG